MSQQGEHQRPETGEQSDWWSQLYDPELSDTGRTRQEDSLDDRFASVSRTVGGGAALPARRTAPEEPVPGSAGALRPAYGGEPGVLPAADPVALSELVPDTVLDSADHGTVSFRAVSLRGERGRQQGAPRGDVLLTARFGSGEAGLLLLAVASGGSGTPGARRAAREVCHAVGGAVGRSHARLAEDMRRVRPGALKPGLNRVTDRIHVRLRAQAAALGLGPEEYTAGLQCLLLPADPRCTLRVFFGSGTGSGSGETGGLFRLRDGGWQDVAPAIPGSTEARTAPALPADGPWPADEPPAPAAPFRFRAGESRHGDVLLMSTEGFAGPLRCESAARRLAGNWGGPSGPPGSAAYLADVQSCTDGHGGDRTAVAVWEH